MFEQLDEVESVFQSLEAQLNSAEVASNPARFQKLSKERHSLEALVLCYREYRRAKAQFAENVALSQESDADLREMAIAENKELGETILGLEKQLSVLLLPKDPNDEKNIVLEIRAGAGGDEAGIFAGELLKMYLKFADNQGWKHELLSASTNDVGGYKEIIGLIQGDRVYSRLKYESGVHRVQRVPKTETQGRVHTSTVTVAVLPEAEEVEVHVDPNDLRIDVFRSSGPGGQSVNTTDSAVRITHLPTGLVVVCRDEKSQHKNKAKAMKILISRLYDMHQREADAKVSADRQSQVGTGDRSEKIRTYNFPQGRVTDHRIGVTIHQIDSFMAGAIDDLMSQIASYYQAEALKNQSTDGALKSIVGRSRS